MYLTLYFMLHATLQPYFIASTLIMVKREGGKDRCTMYSPYYFIIMEYRMQHRKSFTTLRVKYISIIITIIIV